VPDRRSRPDRRSPNDFFSASDLLPATPIGGWIAASRSARQATVASSGDLIADAKIAVADGTRDYRRCMTAAYRLPAISSINAPIDRFTLSLLILFKAIRVR
jgi:hypothetical protein